jgi:hypothetical protein
MFHVLQAIKMHVGDQFAAVFTSLLFLTQDAQSLFSCQNFTSSVKNTSDSTNYVGEERQRSGGSFVIYNDNPRAVTTLSLISEPPISREMGSEHSIPDVRQRTNTLHTT